MSQHAFRRADLPPHLVARALELLGQNTPDSRLAAAQLLARGYAVDEEQRVAELDPDDRPAPLHTLDEDEDEG